MMVATVIWAAKYRVIAWSSLGIFFVAFVLFFVSYVGTSWYVVPVENNKYPPDNPVSPLTMGLFWVCYRGHCMYDSRQSYYIVNLLPPQMGITYAFQHYITACQGIITVAMVCSIVTLALYFLFLTGWSFSFFIGYPTGGVQILAGVAALIGAIIFGSTFRGNSKSLPYGWSFGLMCVALIIYILNGIFVVILTITIQRKGRVGAINTSTGLAKPLMG